MTNPLLNLSSLPPFDAILPEHVIPAIKSALEHCRQTVINIVSQSTNEFTWENLCQPLAEANNTLSRIWSPISHLNAVKNSQELREVYEQSLLLLSEYNTWIGHHTGLHQAYVNLRNSQQYLQLSKAQKKVVDNTLRDFKLSGIELPLEKKKRYGQIIIALSKLESDYNNNVLDATMGWSKLITDKNVLAGIPEDILAIAHSQALTRKQEGWLLTLDIPSYLPVITYCDNAALRKEIYYAYNTRASDQGPNAGKWDNGPIMNEILALRYELAQILGFNSYADKSLFTKMANSPQQVISFLNDLVKISRPYGKQELNRLEHFARCHFGCTKLNPWDIAYYSEKQKQFLFSINDEQLRPYFPEPKVIGGLFEIVKRIYGISIKQRNNVSTWHPEVKFFDIFDEHGNLRGSFYLDLYARDNKRDGAWMDDCISMMRKANGKLQKPIAYLTCNFNRPVNDKPALFTHSELITLFHEFGHGLHHMLTCIETLGVSGIGGVPWDAVELPSQFMENYCWQPDALSFISGHYETGEPIPSFLLKNLLKLKNYQAALFILRQLEFGLFDFLLHYKYHPNHKTCLLDTLAEVQNKVAVIPTVSWRRFPHTFSHIFSGCYAAGYYSYLWADVLAADAWSRFEEEGIFNRNTGKSFLDTILSRGGSEDPMVLFINFRGREPRLDALLYQFGIHKK